MLQQMAWDSQFVGSLYCCSTKTSSRTTSKLQVKVSCRSAGDCFLLFYMLLLLPLLQVKPLLFVKVEFYTISHSLWRSFRKGSDKIQVRVDATSILVFLNPVWIHDHLNTVSGVLIKSQNFNGWSNVWPTVHSFMVWFPKTHFLNLGKWWLWMSLHSPLSIVSRCPSTVV